MLYNARPIHWSHFERIELSIILKKPANCKWNEISVIFIATWIASSKRISWRQMYMWLIGNHKIVQWHYISYWIWLLGRILGRTIVVRTALPNWAIKTKAELYGQWLIQYVILNWSMYILEKSRGKGFALLLKQVWRSINTMNVQLFSETTRDHSMS